MLKRLFDILVSFTALILLLPLFLLIAVWIKMDSKGSVFYRQERVGKNFVPFHLFKFRSMENNAEQKGQLTVGMRDSRITRSGYFIRKYKLDELPQLINVLLGEMSVVGPRPEVKKYVDMYKQEQRKVLSVKPGITDYASLQFSNENEILGKSTEPEKTYIEDIMPQKLALALHYVENQSFWVDIQLIAKTLIKIISHDKSL
jgi:lipopolysaccharide/colanic/teichoic acid biosynthesis glycosyltransferase